MKQFNIIVKNKIGSLAEVTGCLAKSAVNIKAIATEAVCAFELPAEGKPKNGLIKVVTDDLSTTRNALQKNNINFTESDIMVLELIDRPGELAKVAGKLAEAGVNVESVYLLGKNKENNRGQIAFSVDNLKQASGVVKDFKAY
ncbi:MAG: hypothetical protein ABH829_01045 [archaeon]